ncbi:uncharacterized protein LOC119669500 [Teleopsis dalmanni]|uniref:uncharacterized protein LOC119669500 n=1 Tax=Teleopsis dalmanni TaxID=139649 RepID=UPI0018CD983E|nr:uncharacterized protein LOC119669500 [Teleopsis dalmanni]
MKYVSVFYILCLACHLSTAAKPARNVPATNSTPVGPNLVQELQELQGLIAIKPIKELVARYLLNDEQFQSIIRSINTNEAFMLRVRFMQQPEVITLKAWIRMQMMYLEDSLEMDKSIEMNIFNPLSYWSNSVFGWPGFVAEFFAYYPEQLVRSHIAAKVAQNGTFAQLWTRVTAVGAAYNRVMSFPASQVVIAQLEAIGVNTTEIDQFIRTQLDWVKVNATTPTSGPVASAAYGPLTYGSSIYGPPIQY